MGLGEWGACYLTLCPISKAGGGTVGRAGSEEALTVSSKHSLCVLAESSLFAVTRGPVNVAGGTAGVGADPSLRREGEPPTPAP